MRPDILDDQEAAESTALTTPLTREQQVEHVISLMGEGESENAACKIVGINRGTFRSAALRYAAADKYAQALELMAHDHAGRIDEVIEDMRNGKIDASMARVEIDVRKWFASKFLPKRYGDKVQHSNDPDNPMPGATVVVSLVKPSDAHD